MAQLPTLNVSIYVSINDSKTTALRINEYEVESNTNRNRAGKRPSNVR